mgnify:CR=1 FL=1
MKIFIPYYGTFKFERSVKNHFFVAPSNISFILKICYDEKNIRKRVVYFLSTINKTITRSVYESDRNTSSINNQTNNCNPDDVTTTTIVPTTLVVANKVNSFSGILQGNVITVSISLQSENGGIDETYNQRFFLKNYDLYIKIQKVDNKYLFFY